MKIGVYGSYGYTGRLIVEEARRKGLEVVLAGRDEAALIAQHKETGLPYVVAKVNEIGPLSKFLEQIRVVIHCGGPFQHTALDMARACLRAGVHYTDITGEYQVFEMLQELDEQARTAGLTLMPGTGFDVVPSDCLAIHLHRRLPTATHLRLAFAMTKGGLSRGTSKTMTEGLGEGSMIRQNGVLVSIPLGGITDTIDFGPFQSLAMCIPWGDISTAYRSTGIPNIEVLMAAKPSMVRAARFARLAGPLLRSRWVKNFLQRRIDNRPPGPSDERRASGRTFLWGMAKDSIGNEKVTLLETPNGYTLTALTAVQVAEHILSGKFSAGFQTPAMAFGPDFILTIPACKFTDR